MKQVILGILLAAIVILQLIIVTRLDYLEDRVQGLDEVVFPSTPIQF